MQSEMWVANERLLELDRLKATFAAMLVHDLRSPLAVVDHSLGFLEMRRFSDDRELEELVGYSAEAQDKTLAMITEVLDIYRTEQTKETRPLVAGDIAEVLDRCAVAARIEALHRKPAAGRARRPAARAGHHEPVDQRAQVHPRRRLRHAGGACACRGPLRPHRGSRHGRRDRRCRATTCPTPGTAFRPT
jgi:signal transduction histidine kinase